MRRPLALLAFLAATGAGASAQTQLFVGPGVGPGLGGVAIGARDVLLDLFTREAAVYADYQPRVLGGPGRLLVAAAAGGAVRVTRVMAVARGSAPGPLDVDAGVRLGPAFYYAFGEQTAEDRARSFRIAFDPFARVTLGLRGGRVVFAEMGTQQPSLRAGLAF